VVVLTAVLPRRTRGEVDQLRPQFEALCHTRPPVKGAGFELSLQDREHRDDGGGSIGKEPGALGNQPDGS